MLEFSPELVKVIDRVGPNTLIRGPLPLTHTGAFAYKEIAEAAGLDLDARYFVDLSLLDGTAEQWFLATEMRAFGLTVPEPSYWPPFLRPDYHPEKGVTATLTTPNGTIPADFFWWPIKGDDPFGKTGYNFAGLVERLYRLMHDTRPKNIYIHCLVGADRTGALHGGYMLRKGEPLHRVLQLINCTPAGLPTPDYIRLIEAYAASLPL